jgi:uncharacterized protein (UPF0548 family)
MFSLHKPADAELLRQLEAAKSLPLNYGLPSITERERAPLPTGFVRDHTRTEIGHGEAAFAAAKAAFRRWQQFDLGWVRVANPSAEVEADQLIAVEAHTLGLWSVNISRIIYTIDEEDRFGFAYGTTSSHVESGEERFLLEFYPVSGVTCYDLLAISGPAHWLAKLGYPYTRSQQHRFARDSHQRMKQISASIS